MISSVFGKTKPINYIILLSFLFLFYWYSNLYLFGKNFDSLDWILQTAVLGFLLFSIFVVNFVVTRNQITGANSYAILYFTLLVILFPGVLRDNNAILCGFFLMLAFRRAISLRSLRDIRMKLFDASLWVAVASIFYDWALLFLILVFATLYMYEPKNFRNWLVPIIAVSTVALIAFTALIFAGDTNFFVNHYTFELGAYTTPGTLLTEGRKWIGYGIVILLVGIYVFFKIGKLGLGRINVMRIVGISFALGMVISLLETTSVTSPVFLTFLPAAALLAKYVETIKRAKIRETVLILSVALPILFLIAEHMVN